MCKGVDRINSHHWMHADLIHLIRFLSTCCYYDDGQKISLQTTFLVFCRLNKFPMVGAAWGCRLAFCSILLHFYLKTAAAESIPVIK